jgi:hypothetical protein
MSVSIDDLARWERLLDEGEHILWQGAPLPGIRNVRSRVVKTLLGLGLLGGGLAMLVATLDHLYSEGMKINVALFLVVGAILVAAGLEYAFHQWRAAARAHISTRYVLTNHCAYIAVGTGFGSVSSYRVLPDTAVELDLYDDYGDLWFHVGPKYAVTNAQTTARIGFEGIADGKAVFMLTRKIQSGQS